MRLYLNKDVLTAANERLDYIFARYENIVVSVSGGKDSTLLFELTYRKATTLGRKIHAFFLDQEAEYQSTIDIIREIMSRPNTIPHWYQVPLYMTNATSYTDEFLYAWGPEEEDKWMRPKDPLTIHQITEPYPKRFYPFIDWFEEQAAPNTCFLVGLRAEESLNRYRAVIKNPGVENILWSSKSAGRGDAIKFYPIYDWSFDDIFYYFYKEGVSYNRIYDFLHAIDDKEQITKYRVSFLLHEKSYQSLATLQAFEPDTYEKLLKRIGGVRTAARYAEEQTVYKAGKLPEKFGSWKEYRDYLLATTPLKHKERFQKRFANQKDAPEVHRAQVGQLLINDYENNKPPTVSTSIKAKEEEENWREKWMKIL